MTKNDLSSHFPPAPEDHHSKQSKPTFKMKEPNASLFSDDAEFNRIYPERFQLKSKKHWTPLLIAQKAAEFLAEPNARVLDIGSGIGKFCLTAAYHYPQTFFYGVEQRKELVNLSENAKEYTGLTNVHFIHANLTQVDFKEFDHFYFFNSFHENLEPENSIDETIETSVSLYIYYTEYLFTLLNEKPAGTRLVTFHGLGEKMPPDYSLVDISYNTLLRMWIKQ